jgi:LAS superfamily LD-carboxypeptidase LdcB
MKKFIQVHNIFTKYHVFITMVLVCLVLLIIGFGEYRRAVLVKKINIENQTLTIDFTEKVKNLEEQINSIVAQNNLLNDTVQTEIVKNSALADQVEQVADTADALDKLSKVDPQLLQKYSKVFFLNEHYEPADLATISSQYRFDSKIKYKVLDQVLPHLEKMLADAEGDGINLKVISAYRSFGEQTALKSSYQVTYGAGTANQFSADQGYSEHQLGTTIDLTTPDSNGNLDLFDKTEAFIWMTDNAYKYGFIMSYPKDNIYYVYEPWHWRFVGEDLARRLDRQNKNFYDLDQRIINNYLGLFFD